MAVSRSTSFSQENGSTPALVRFLCSSVGVFLFIDNTSVLFHGFLAKTNDFSRSDVLSESSITILTQQFAESAQNVADAPSRQQ